MIYTLGDKLTCIRPCVNPDIKFTIDQIYTVYNIGIEPCVLSSSGADHMVNHEMIKPCFQLLREKENNNMITNILTDVKKFVAEHKSTVYCVAVMLLIDHLVFNGSFRAKLQSIMSKLIDKVEQKLDGKPDAK